MLYKKPNMLVQGAIFLSLLAGVGYATLKHPERILNLGSFTFIFGFILLLLCVLPFGKQILGDRSKRYSFSKYLTLLFAGQGALLVISLTVGLAFIAMGPKLSAGTIVATQAQILLKEYYLSSWGLFPWAVFGVWGLMMAYLAYVKKAYPLVGGGARLLLKDFFEASIKSYNENMVSSATLLCLVFSVSAVILLLGYFVESHLGFISHTALPFVSVFVLSCVYPIFYWTLHKNKKIKYNKKLHLAKILLILTVLITPILVFSAWLGNWFLHSMPIQAAQLPGDCSQYFDFSALKMRTAGIFWGWWLLWTPLAGSFIARVSQGRTVRELVGGVLCLPVILTILFSLAPDFCFVIFLKIQNYFVDYQSVISIILSLLTLVILFLMTRGLKNNLFFYAGFMPLPYPLKTSRTDLQWAPKLSGSGKLFMMLTVGVMSALLLHTLGGWFVISFQILAFGAFMISILYMGAFGLMVELGREGLLYHRPITSETSDLV